MKLFYGHVEFLSGSGVYVKQIATKLAHSPVACGKIDKTHVCKWCTSALGKSLTTETETAPVMNKRSHMWEVRKHEEEVSRYKLRNEAHDTVG